MDKFWCRGKTPLDEYFNGGEWIVGYYTCFNGTEHRIYDGYAETDCGDYYPDWENVVPKTVGRYTGLRDKYGERIFEGDIVQVEDRVYEVKYLFGQFFVGTNMPIAYKRFECEVVGNVYDNPELMGN